MRNRIPYTIISVLILCKCFVWWLLFWGTDYSKVEPTLMGVFEPVHQFSYSILSSFLLIGILFKSRFALIAMFVAFVINIGIFVFRGSTVYQSLLDPVVLIILCLVLYYRKPNSWFGASES
jgi:cellulose synthase/poly-beta-1,6-N-acetylglucosamine synthase-like glycosyltransferase